MNRITGIKEHFFSIKPFNAIKIRIWSEHIKHNLKFFLKIPLVHGEEKLWRRFKVTWIAINNLKNIYQYLYMYFACLGVCLYPINVKTTETIGPNIFWDNSHHHIVSWMLRTAKMCLQKIQIFVKLWNPRKQYAKMRKLILFLLL